MSDQPETNGTDAALGMEYNGAEGHETDTVASIIAEMRDTWTDTPPSALSDLADRIEAAAARERDEDRQLAAIAESDEAFARCARCDRPERAPVNAAMREALHECLAAVTHLRALFCNTDPMQGPDRAIRVNDLEPIADQIERATAALAVPARNCDRFANENEAYAAFADAGYSFGADTGERMYKYCRWLFATAEGGDHA